MLWAVKSKSGFRIVVLRKAGCRVSPNGRFQCCAFPPATRVKKQVPVQPQVSDLLSAGVPSYLGSAREAHFTANLQAQGVGLAIRSLIGIFQQDFMLRLRSDLSSRMEHSGVVLGLRLGHLDSVLGCSAGSKKRSTDKVVAEFRSELQCLIDN